MGLVFPAKYRRDIFTEEVSETLKLVCIEISKRFEIHFVEIGLEENHVHFLVQSVPTSAVRRIVTVIKSITAREIFLKYKGVKNIFGVETLGQEVSMRIRLANMQTLKEYNAILQIKVRIEESLFNN